MSESGSSGEGVLRRITAIGLMAMALLVAGCASDAPRSPGAPGGTPTTTPSADAPTQSAAPTSPPTDESPIGGPAFDPEDPNTWVIDFEGIGPFTLGGSFAEQFHDQTYYSDSSRNEDDCEQPPYTLQTRLTWRPSNRDGRDGELHPLMSIQRSDDGDTVIGVQVRDGLYWDATPHTRDGFGLGSDFREVIAAYPDLVHLPNPLGGGYEEWPHEFYRSTSASGVSIFFGVTQPSEYRPTPTVIWIDVSMGSEPSFAWCTRYPT